MQLAVFFTILYILYINSINSISITAYLADISVLWL
jgi:hypothetical protein